MRPTLAVLAATLAALLSAAGCGAGTPLAAAARHPSPAAAAEPLYLGDGSVISVVDGATGHVRLRLPAGAPSPDWSRLYSVAGSDGNVQLRVVDAAGGAVVRALSVPAWVSDARLSANGRWLALAGKPDARAPQTRFQVRDAGLDGAPIDVELPGAFAFDGLSGDGQRLYLLQLKRDGSYQVKLYDLTARRLVPQAIVDKYDASTVMSGASVNSLTTADGQEQLTLYERDSRDRAFIHVLPVGAYTGFAYCVDLPPPGAGWTLAAGPDGRRFYAANMISGAVVRLTAARMDPPEVSSGSLVVATSRFAPVRDAEAKEDVRRTAAAVGADGTTLFAGAGTSVMRIDTGSLRPDGMARLEGEQVLSLATGRSGWLYATTSSGRLLRIDPGSMRVAWRSETAFSGSSILHTGS